MPDVDTIDEQISLLEFAHKKMVWPLVSLVANDLTNEFVNNEADWIDHENCLELIGVADRLQFDDFDQNSAGSRLKVLRTAGIEFAVRPANFLKIDTSDAFKQLSQELQTEILQKHQ